MALELRGRSLHKLHFEMLYIISAYKNDFQTSYKIPKVETQDRIYLHKIELGSPENKSQKNLETRNQILKIINQIFIRKLLTHPRFFNLLHLNLKIEQHHLNHGFQTYQHLNKLLLLVFKSQEQIVLMHVFQKVFSRETTEY